MPTTHTAAAATPATTAFDDADDVGSIHYRLAPIDVGFNLRAEGVQVQIKSAATLRVSYADRSGRRVVSSGPIDGVVALLRASGYDVLVTQ